MTFLLVTDLDHTLVGDDGAMQSLYRHIARVGATLVYSTGRSLSSYQTLEQSRQLQPPQVLITSVGTEIYWRPEELASTDQAIADPAWSQQLSPSWHRGHIEAIAAQFPELRPQPDPEQRPFKISYFLAPEAATTVLPQLERRLQGLGDPEQPPIQCVYSSDRDLDILPGRANKGSAMGFVRDRLGFTPERTLACGDSGNDLALFRDRPERGVIVGNAQTELLQWHQRAGQSHHYLAQAHYAAGIIEGLQQLGWI
jgi:sucrose-6-phosphatase